MGDESLRRRDVLRSGVAAGLVWSGWTSPGLAQDETTTAQEETTTAQDDTAAQSQRGRYAFSYSLQRRDRFVVRFQPRDSASDPVTETVPSNCFDGGNAREFQLFVVRAYRGSIDLGHRDLFVPTRATETPNTTRAEGATTTPDGTPEETTPENETTPGTEATQTGERTTETTTTEGTPTGGTTARGDGTTAAGESTLPEIRRGEWYRVESSTRCVSFNRLTLEPTEQPETTPGRR